MNGWKVGGGYVVTWQLINLDFFCKCYYSNVQFLKKDFDVEQLI